MAKNYHYAAYPFMHWCLSHYFFDAKHQLWASAPFYNPLSPDTTPYQLYGKLLTLISRGEAGGIQEWRDFLKKEINGHIGDKTLQERLMAVMETLALDFFVPIIYRVDIEALPFGLATQGDSEGKLGTQHFQLRALEETHFDMLFADFQHEGILKLWRGMPNAEAALELLEGYS